MSYPQPREPSVAPQYPPPSGSHGGPTTPYPFAYPVPQATAAPSGPFPGDDGALREPLSAAARNTAVWSHLGVLLAGLVVAVLSVPLGVLVLAGYLTWLVPFLLRRGPGSQSRFVREHATQSLNFELTAYAVGLGLAALASAGVRLGLAAMAGSTALWSLMAVVSGLALIAFFVFYVVIRVIASVKAGRGAPFRYPLCIPFVR